jgi:hypothetical protein
MAYPANTQYQRSLSWTPTYEEGEAPATHAKYSDAVPVGLWLRTTYQILNPGSGAMEIQVSNKATPDPTTDTDWTVVHTTSAANVALQLPDSYRWVRYTIATCANAPTVYMHGGGRADA